jgi:membrane protease YdiL (CAAX protease family)
MPAEETLHPSDRPTPTPKTRRGIAPLWHTVVLVVAIIAISIVGADRMTAAGSGDPHRIIHYALSALLELVLVGFVFLGLRLRRVPLRSLFGVFPCGLNNITKELGIALLFWLVSMFVLGTTALAWSAVQTAIYDRHVKSQSPSAVKEPSPQQQQIEMAKKLMTLAPANGLEIAAWGALCIVVGFSEELVFRGYLQLQSISLLRSTALGLAISALVFGAAHGYQGIRGMCLISIYGALFGGIALLRRNLLPGMLAHSWHDFATGLLLSLIRETRLLDRLPNLH